jgi:hypothetical protein
MAVPALKYAVGQNGWAAGGHWLDRGTVVDTSVWLEFANVVPPIDAVPLNQQTYNWFVSKGVVGLGYPYERVAVVAGVTGVLPPASMPGGGAGYPWIYY